MIKGGSGFMDNSVFRKSSIDRVSSPEQLNDYIRVSNPSIWIILAAVIILLGSVLVWSIYGTLETTIDKKGISRDGEVVCYLPVSSEISKGMAAKIGDKEGIITGISDTPISKQELEKLYGDREEYTLYAISPAEWSYEVNIDVEGLANGIVDVSIILESINPISFLLN